MLTCGTIEYSTNFMNYKTPLQLIGNTPLVRLDIVPDTIILAKLELYNLTGSAKDKMALGMLTKAEQEGKLKKGGTIIEATTGNTGIAFSALAAMRGYRMIAVIPEGQSLERIKMMRVYGTKVIITPKHLGPQGAIDERDRLAKEHPDYWVPDQFGNKANITAQEGTTAKEILEQTNGEIDAIIHGVGTGGTLMACANLLKKANPKIRIIAVEPSESAVMSGGKPGHHNIQGIGEGFIPSIVDMRSFDEVVAVSTDEAIETTKELARKTGIFAGFSSGANIAAIRKISKRTNERFVTFLCDRGERYLSVEALGIQE